MWPSRVKMRRFVILIALPVLLLGLFNLASSFFTHKVEIAPGTTVIGLQKNGFDLFLGIPFAEPPVGNLRFKNPVPVPLWTGNRWAIYPRLYCYQRDDQLPLPASGSEDCLYLNIYRPHNISPTNVIVYIHGGGFYGGNNMPLLYGGDFLMETQDVVLVTLTYRVNIFGFFATGDLASPGNYGLKDTTMALRWVQKNIRAFGGDPDKVTLMGQSAGSVAVNLHLLTNHSHGLYKNAYMISGLAARSWGDPLEDPRGYINRHARALGIDKPESLSSEEIVEKFREIPARQLVSTIPELYDWDILPVANYLPAVEPEGSPDPFLTVHPREAMESGQIQKVPIMNSIIPSGDGFNFVQPLVRFFDKQKDFNERIYEVMPVVLRMDRNHPNIKQIVDKIRYEYFGPTGLIPPNDVEKVIQMETDHLFERPFFESMEQFARASDQPVYGHYFKYGGKRSLSLFFARSWRDYGVVHADDLLYVFRLRILFPFQLNARDTRAKDYYLEHILNFVKNDDPGYERYSRDSQKVALFENSDGEMSRSMVGIHKKTFWREIWELYDTGRGGNKSGD